MKKNIFIAGASGAIGSAFTQLFCKDPDVGKIVAASRKLNDFNDDKIHSIEIDYRNEETFNNLSKISYLESIDTIVIASGMLHTDTINPEKSLNNVDLASMQDVFQVNTFGPFYLVKELFPLIKKSKAVKVVFLTARVGSITDNGLGGWYSYRSSKTALNMLIKNLSIELQRISKEHAVIGIHPGTVASNLSGPFLKNVKHNIFTPEESAAYMGQVIHKINPADSGKCFDFSGKEIDP